jgi:acetyl-CoA synthase
MDKKTITLGLTKLFNITDELLESISEEIQKITFPDTGYYLPTIYAFYNKKIKTIDELITFYKEFKNDFLEEKDSEIKISSSLYSFILLEIIEAINYNQKDDQLQTDSFFIPDTIFRQLGVPLVDGTIRGIAVVYGECSSQKELSRIIKDFQKGNLLVFVLGKIPKQLANLDIETGLEKFIITIGSGKTAVAHAINLILRISLAFGGIQPGDQEKLLNYIQEKVPAFVLSLGELSDIEQTVLHGLLTCGIPIINDQGFNAPSNGLYSFDDFTVLPELCYKSKNIKPKIEKIDIPIDYGFVYEGESVRKADTYLEFGGGRTVAVEYLKAVPESEISDGKITIQGKGTGDFLSGSTSPLGVLVEVSGKGMQKDFEPVLERRIHTYLNYGNGLWHNAQRDLIWVRFSKEAVDNGFSFHHFAKIIYSKLHEEYSEIISKVQVTIFTDEARVKKLAQEAKEVFNKRDARLENLTDQSVDTFYSCLLCQSFAPNHVCVVTPERTGLCGAVNWLDAKTSYEINPSGANQPITVNEPLDELYGSWENVNQYVHKESHGTIEEVCLYSLMKNPMTACGCFECIVVVIPEANGVLIVNREYRGDTPLGLSFSSLAGEVGGGVQTPGFMGIGKRYIASKKFLQAEGGIHRVVWMPSILKAELQSLVESSELDFLEKVADEQKVSDITELTAYLEDVEHPALAMDPIFEVN